MYIAVRGCIIARSVKNYNVNKVNHESYREAICSRIQCVCAKRRLILSSEDVSTFRSSCGLGNYRLAEDSLPHGVRESQNY